MSNLWTPETLEQQILGELNQDRNAAGGAAPQRLARIVQHTYSDLWEGHDWLFRRVYGTLALTASTATADLPTDFDKLDQKWIEDSSNQGSLIFTTDLQAFEQRRHDESASTGIPVIALIRPKTSLTTSYLWEVIVAPTPSQAFSCPYVYLRLAPDLLPSGSPLWPRPFHRGWYLLALARSQRAFRRGDDWKETFAAHRAWLARAESQNDEVLTSDTPVIRDGYNDVGRLGSSYARMGGLAGF